MLTLRKKSIRVKPKSCPSEMRRKGKSEGGDEKGSLGNPETQLWGGGGGGGGGMNKGRTLSGKRGKRADDGTSLREKKRLSGRNGAPERSNVTTEIPIGARLWEQEVKFKGRWESTSEPEGG